MRLDGKIEGDREEGKAAGLEFRISCSAVLGCTVSFGFAEGLQIHVG